MRTLTSGPWPAMMLSAVLVTACSGEKRETVAQAPTAPPPAATPATELAPALPAEAPIPAETLAAIDTTLATVKAFNAKALADIARIEKAERRIRDQATRALDAARRGETSRVGAAKADAEAAHQSLVDGLAAFRKAAADQQTALAAALATCGVPVTDPLAPSLPPPTAKAPAAKAPARPAVGAAAAAGTAVPATGLAANAACLALPAEQALLAQNIAAVAARYEAAEASYRQERPKLEEAAATLALGR